MTRHPVRINDFESALLQVHQRLPVRGLAGVADAVKHRVATDHRPKLHAEPAPRQLALLPRLIAVRETHPVQRDQPPDQFFAHPGLALARRIGAAAHHFLERRVVTDFKKWGEDVALLLARKLHLVQVLHPAIAARGPADRPRFAVHPVDHVPADIVPEDRHRIIANPRGAEHVKQTAHWRAHVLKTLKV